MNNITIQFECHLTKTKKEKFLYNFDFVKCSHHLISKYKYLKQIHNFFCLRNWKEKGEDGRLKKSWDGGLEKGEDGFMGEEPESGGERTHEEMKMTEKD